MTLAAPSPAAAPDTDPFADLDHKPRRWWILLLLVAVLAVGGGVWWRRRNRPQQASRYVTVHLARGDLAEIVEATGTVQPVRQVQVGSQVSGRVLTVTADFDTRVHVGDVLAELDAAPFRARVGQARAAVLSAQAQLVRAQADLAQQERTLRRAQQLRAGQLNSQADLDAAQATRDASAAQIGVARAELARTRAALEVEEMNLQYSRITAPINGVVINRTVDPGVTVAASFQAPNLFQIAEDLTHMRVLADIDEADVGKLHPDLVAEVRVDAYPGQPFRGVVSQLRFGSSVNQGVVTYPAVIDLPNPDLRLRPGMTATVTLTTARRTNVLRVPNAALRFRPSDASPSGGRSGASGAGGGGGGRMRRGGGTPGSNEGPGRGRLFVLRAGRPAMVPVRTGITDGIFTEVEGEGLTEGAELITDELEDSSGAAPAASGGGTSGGQRPGQSGPRPPRMF